MNRFTRESLWTGAAILSLNLPSPALAATARQDAQVPGAAAGSPDRTVVRNGGGDAGQAIPTPAEPSGLPDVVVTARRRTENLRDVPVAVTSISGAQLQAQNIARLTEIVAIEPTFTLSLSANQPLVFIRGLGTNGGATFDQAVGKFVDGISYGRDFYARLPLYDLSRLEVLKGPQVLLYGNSTTAGALNMTTNKPGSRFSADASEVYDFVSHETLLQGGVTVPLADWAALRVASIYQNRARGWLFNVATGRHEPTTKVFGIRPTLRLTPVERLEIVLRAEFDHVNERGATSQTIRQSAIPARSFVDVTLDDRRDSNLFAAPFLSKEFLRLRSKTYQADVNYDVAGATLSSTTGYLRATNGVNSGAGSQRQYFASFAGQEYRQFSEELRLKGKVGSFDYLGGIYYQHDKLEVYDVNNVNLSALSLPIPPFGRLSYMRQVSKTFSPFVDLTMHLTENLSLSTGARYSVIRRDIDQSITALSLVPGILPGFALEDAVPFINPALGGLLVSALGSTPHGFTDIKRRENHLQPQVVIQYKTGGAMFYAKYVKGNKAGSVDRVYGGTSPALAQFRPEKAVSFEAGVKGISSDRNLRYALNAFNTTFTDLQTSVFIGNALFVANVGKARSRGVEAAVTYRAAPQLTFDATASYIDAKYVDYANLPCTTAQTAATPVGCRQNLSGARLPYTSKFNAGLSVVFEQPVAGDYVLTAGVATVARSAFDTSPVNDPLGRQRRFATIDAHLDLKPGSSWWTVSLFGRNLTDVNYKEYSAGPPLVPGAFQTYVSRGRQIGIRLDQHF